MQKLIEKNLYAVILAGGSGTRFWPLSRTDKPKQFLDIIGDKTLFELSLKRINSIVPAENIFVVTNKKHKGYVLKLGKQFNISAKNVLCEPSGKNTAPAICFASSMIKRINADALIGVFPSDHLIQNQKDFAVSLKNAFCLAAKEYLVLFGITPSRPETGYGYLKVSRKKKEDILFVDKFTEKPDFATAKKFVSAKNYLWNSGMFVWSARTIMEEFDKYLPQVSNFFLKNDTLKKVELNWKNLPNISIDYGILEKSSKVAAIEAKNIGWSDLGSWESLYDVLSGNKIINVIRGDVIDIDSKNSLIFGFNKPIAAIGLEDIVIIDTKDALLVCRKQDSQKVKDAVSFLKDKKSKAI